MYSPFEDGAAGSDPSKPQQASQPQPNPYRPYYPQHNPYLHATPHYFPPPYPQSVPMLYQPPPPPYPPPNTRLSGPPQPQRNQEEDKSLEQLLAKMSKQATAQNQRNYTNFVPTQNFQQIAANEKKRKQFPFVHNEKTGQKNKRRKRFDDAPSYVTSVPPPAPISKDPIIGYCMNLEKDYYRLTEDTDPSTIRPEYILKKSLKHLLELWKSQKMDYLTICNQMKAIRQDLTVQHIKNSFSVEVYEAHARLALENDDFREFNQCQTQLSILYEQNPHQSNEMEFIAYRLLYKLKNGTSQHAVLMHDIQELNYQQRNNSFVSHAIDTCLAFYGNNYYRFFKLYRTAPNMGKAVIGLYLDETRRTFLKAFTRSHPNPVDLTWISGLMGFDNITEFRGFLGDGAVFVQMENSIFLNLKKSSF